MVSRPPLSRIVITGVGLTAPNGNSLAEYRANLLAGKPGGEFVDRRYIGRVPAGVCHFDALRYQKKKELRVGTRAGSISIYCAREAVAHSGIAWDAVDRRRVGIDVNVTRKDGDEHTNKQ